MTEEQAKALTYGELMMLCEGHGTSKIYKRHLEALAARERAVWEEAAIAFDVTFMASDERLANMRDHRVDVFYKWCRQQAEQQNGQ